jgi:hypothetical protein
VSQLRWGIPAISQSAFEACGDVSEQKDRPGDTIRAEYHDGTPSFQFGSTKLGETVAGTPCKLEGTTPEITSGQDDVGVRIDEGGIIRLGRQTIVGEEESPDG